MSELAEIRERHKKEIEQFQEACPHTNRQWLEYHWAPGHFSGQMNLVCNRCEKTLETKNVYKDLRQDAKITEVWDRDEGDNGWCLPQDMGDQ